jgi:hypothetical protein
MKGVRLFFQTLFLGKVKLLTFLAILIFAASILFTYFNFHLTIARLLSDIGISFLAGAIVSAFEELKGGRAFRLMDFFSIESSKQIALVVPMFDYGYVVPDPAKPTIQIELSKIPSISKIDSFAANHFALLIQSHSIGMARVITDVEAIAIINDEHRIQEYSCFISIGLNSNRFSKKLAAEKLNANVVKFENPVGTSPGDKIMSIYENDHNFNDETPNKKNCSDIVLFTKMACTTPSNSADYSVIICGGLNATGTSIVAPFVYENWFNRISNEEFDDQTKVINAKNFALFYKVNGQKNTLLDTKAKINPRPFHTIKF